MNKRDFKKYAENQGYSACITMMSVADNSEKIDNEKVEKAVNRILNAVTEAKHNADVTFDKGVKAFDNIVEYSKAKKAFYKQLFKKIYDDFYNEIDEAVKEFNAAIPEDMKKENKAEK